MKKQLSILFAVLMIAFISTAQTVSLSPTPTGLTVNVTGSYGYCEVYKTIVSSTPMCYGGLPVFDNNCASYTQVFDNTLYAKVAKISGSSATIPYNSPFNNGFGINLLSDGEVMFIFYASNGNWQTTVKQSYVSPTTFNPPACPNAAPVVNLWYYSDSHLLVAAVVNERDNCPLVATITKNGTTITATNVKSLCGASASILPQAWNTMVFNVTEGGTYQATVTNSGGLGTATVVVPTAPTAPKGKGKK